MTKRVYEVIEPGFDGSTDATDDRISWVVGTSQEQVRSFYPNGEIRETSLPIDCDGIDRVLEAA